MRIHSILIATLLAGCQSQTPPVTQELTDAQRSEIATAVKEVVDSVGAAARRIDADAVFLHMSKADGLCLFGMSISPCSEVTKSFRDAWRPDNKDRLQRQEMDGVDVRVMPMTPTIALVAMTTKENRAVQSDGKVVRASFESFFVYVLEDGKWKFHSGQQAGFPIAAPATP